MRDLAKEIRLDLWVINHFSVLPTDDRFLRLTDNQKEMILTGFLENPRDEDLYLDYLHRRFRETSGITEEQERELTRLGYTPEQMKRMREHLAKVIEAGNAGYSE